MNKVKKLTLILAMTIILPINADDVILTGEFGKYDSNKKIAEINKNAKVVDGNSTLTADKILYYKNNKISEAQGNVNLIDKDGKITTAKDIILNHSTKNVIATDAKIVDGKKILTANKIFYYEKNKLSNAIGDVYFVNEYGKITTAQEIKLYHDKKDAIAYRANQNKDNGTYINAEKIFIYDQKNDIAKNAEFSSCTIDEKDKSRAWLLKVNKIIYKKDEGILEMHNVVMNLNDIPVFYIPLLRRAAPNVKRLDGWLLPYIGNNSNLGTFVVGSYYKTLPGQQDIIFKQIGTSNKIFSLASSYRKKTYNSFTAIDTSYVIKNKTETKKGHLFIDNTYINKSNWKYTSKFETAQNNNYLKDHVYLKHTEKDYLQKSFKAEKNHQNSHFKIKATNFKDIRKNNAPDINVAPIITYEKQIKKSNWNINTFTNFKSINKINKHSNQNISSTLGMSQKIMTKNGIEFTPNLTVRGDLVHYKYAEQQNINGENYKNGKKSLLTPYASTLVSYPLNFYKKNNSFILEPVAGIFISPKRNQLEALPKNDINDNDYFELDEHSLFSINRYSGTDRIDSGKRFSYGIKLKKWKNENYTHAFVGQSIDIYKKNSYSNFVGNINLKQNNYKLYAQFELDKKSYQIRKLETNGSAKFDKTEFSLTYVQVSPIQNSKTKKTKQLSTSILYNINKQWSSGLENTFDFENQEKKLIRNSIIVLYSNQCDCMTTTLKYTKDYSNDIQKADTTLFVQIDFKGLTSIRTTDVLKRLN